MNICIIGFGTFGQFLGTRLRTAGHEVSAFSRGDYAEIARSLGINWISNHDELCASAPDIIILSVAILALEEVVRSLPLQQLGNPLIVDVLSVKAFPKEFLKRVLPNHYDILCTHPMFGPDSGKGSWQGLPFTYDPVRIRDEQRLQQFLDFFKDQGCTMIELSAEEHDEYSASGQFITHTTGRIVDKLHPRSTPINTKGYEQLLTLVEQTKHDSFDLYYGLFRYNPNAKRELEKIEQALRSLKNQLFDRRKQETGTTIIGIQGGLGSFNHQATLELIEKYHFTDVDIRYLITSERVLEALNQGEIEYGVFAIENSGSGTVLPSIYSMSKYPHEIIEIHPMPLTQCLLTKPGQDVTSARQIITHPQAIKQCQKTLAKEFPYLRWDFLSDDFDTAECAKDLSLGNLPEDAVVIASKIAAEKYGLTIAHEGLNDDPENKTSFVLCKRRRM